MTYKSILQDNTDECYICGTTRWLEWHHIFNKADKRRSEQYGLMVRLCHYHHNESPEGMHFNQYNWDMLKADAQKRFEEVYQEDFISIFGRNYV